ncbi:hypothetical protein DPEC_G00187440, partial [Dallia pectoralis]
MEKVSCPTDCDSSKAQNVMEHFDQQGATLPHTDGEHTAVTKRTGTVRDKLQSELRERYGLLSDAYVDLLITEGDVQWHDDRHAAVRPVRPPSDMPTASEEVKIKLDNILKPSLTPDLPQVKTVLTKGHAGSGKTTSVQKFVLNWAEGRANQDVDFVFVFPFLELDWLRDQSFSLSGLIRHFHPSLMSESDTLSLDLNQSKVFFILDGLDQFNHPMDFENMCAESDINKEMPLPVLLANLIWCQLLLPSAYVWVTSRPAAASLIPFNVLPQPRCLTEIRGFDDSQKRIFLKKRFVNEGQVCKTIAQVMKAVALESTRNLCVLCQTPLCCEMLSAIMKSTEEGDSVEIDTQTQLYTHFLLIQISLGANENSERSKTIREDFHKLGKLAFLQLEKGSPIFSGDNLRECRVEISESSVFQRLCRPLITGCEAYPEKMYCFVYTGVQEYLAALHVYLAYANKGRNLLHNPVTVFDWLKRTFRRATLSDLHQCSVDKVMRNPHGKYDLFLCFLLGLSSTPNHLLDLACP